VAAEIGVDRVCEHHDPVASRIGQPHGCKVQMVENVAEGRVDIG
jgi:hypothetical protein